MKRLLLPLLCFACACLPTSISAQTTTDAAKADGKAFGRDQAAAAQSAATTNPDANRIPNFGGVPNQSGYFDDPDRMAREAASQATANTGYRTMRSSRPGTSTLSSRAAMSSTTIRSPTRAA